MKIIKSDSYTNLMFLDCDGVIAIGVNDETGLWGLSLEKQLILGMIIEATNAKIVLSSSWRLHTVNETVEFMNKAGFMYSDKIIGVTIRAYHYIKRDATLLSIPRGVEIKQWLDVHMKYPWIGSPEREMEFKIFDDDGSFKMMRSQKIGVDYNYVILDDDSDMLLEQKNHFIHCNPNVGLTIKDAKKAIKILSKY